jgi:FKBP-type peptidyl-prolyl cis-trans isomerase (trigger factor)
MVNETTGGEITTVADLRDEFRKELMSESIWGFISDEYYVSDFPAGEVEKLYTTNLTYYDQMATSSNMQLGDLLAMYGMSLDSLKNDIMQTSAQTIRDSVLYDAIGEDAGIKLTDDDILDLAREYGYDDIDVFLSDNAATRKQVESYIMKDRITDYMVSLVK